MIAGLLGEALNPNIAGCCPVPSHWPTRLEEIKVTPSEQEVLVNFFKAAIPHLQGKTEPAATYSKHEIHLLENTRWQLPVSVVFLFDQGRKLAGILLLLNSARGHVFSDGGQRQPKTAYELLRGIHVVKKRVVYNEEPIIDFLMRQKVRGLTEILGKRSSWDKRAKILKIQYFERLREGTLASRIGTFALEKPLYKLFLINSLLKGLLTLQSLRMEKKGSDEGTFSTFHGDIKPWNILLGKEGVTFTDYGLSNQTEGRGYSLGYAYPLLFKLGTLNPLETRRFLEQYGTHIDLWSTGLIIVILVKNTFSAAPGLQNYCPPLAFIEKRIFKGHYRRFGEVTQQEVDEEMAKERERFSNHPFSALLEKLWDIAAEFLKVDLEQTLTLKEALSRTELLLALYAPKTKELVDRADTLETRKNP